MKKKNQSTRLSLAKKSVLSLTAGYIFGGAPNSGTCNKYTAANCVTVVEILCGVTFMCIETRNPKC
ncbi:hypothetical protein [Taibaiella koreensis]|uniref:hypothetical protein n=1 Tax=Taibaiella koreensis TaxID=1268548 RepID=UPI000E59E556|nr:hypothetical protein [Taibaiella koreensis]